MNEQSMQKIRHAFQNSTAGMWTLAKMQDGQLRIMNGNVVIAIFNRFEDALFVETVHKLLPGMFNEVRGIPAPVAKASPVAKPVVESKPVAKVVEELPKKKAGRPKSVKPVETPVVPEPETKVFVPKVQPKGVTIPVIEMPKNGNLTDLS
jgi:hypothetical protein